MIEDIKNEYKKIKNDITAVEYVEDFKKAFNAIQEEKVNTNLLKELYYEFLINSFRQSKSEQFIISKLADLEEDLIKSFSEKQKEQLKIYDYLHNELAETQNFTSFIYGYCMANELNMSSNNYTTNDKILNEIIQKYKEGGFNNE